MNSKRVLLSVGAVSVVLGAVGGIYSMSNRFGLGGTEPTPGDTNKVLSAAETTNLESPGLSKPPIALSATVKTEAQSKLVWQQDFTAQPDSRPDSRYWNVATPNLPVYNEEEQVYAPGTHNVRVAGGRLVLEAHRSAKGFTSGRIDTKGKVKVELGGRLEARIKLPRGRGTWPAFWLLSENQPYTTKLRPTEADWQSARLYMWDGEIDIMEAYGAYPGIVEATVHTFGRSQEKQQVLDDSSTFHTYWFEWQENKLVFGVDDTTYSTYDKSGRSDTWPFTKDSQFYIILNLAMGGSGGGQVVERPDDVWRMEIESIKYLRL